LQRRQAFGGAGHVLKENLPDIDQEDAILA
jgi:hypothetical protein